MLLTFSTSGFNSSCKTVQNFSLWFVFTGYDPKFYAISLLKFMQGSLFLQEIQKKTAQVCVVDRPLRLTMSSIKQWLNGVELLEMARTLQDVTGFLMSIQKENRELLDAKQLVTLKSKAEEGMEGKFDLYKAYSEEEGYKALEATYSVQMRIKEFRQELMHYDMEDVFTIPNRFVSDPGRGVSPAPDAKAVDILTAYKEVDLDTVVIACQFRARFGPMYMGQNLVWSGTKLLNSCSEQLRQKIEESTNSLTIDAKTGPVYFKIMADLVIASSSQSMRVLVRRLENISVTDFPGENVSKLCSFARGAIEQLKNCNHLPPDTIALLS